MNVNFPNLAPFGGLTLALPTAIIPFDVLNLSHDVLPLFDAFVVRIGTVDYLLFEIVHELILKILRLNEIAKLEDSEPLITVVSNLK